MLNLINKNYKDNVRLIQKNSTSTFQNIILLFIVGMFFTRCAPIPNFTYTPESTVAPAIVKFENQSEKAERYIWHFGDKATSTEIEPAHRYMASGNYEVELKAMKGKKERIIKQRIVITAPEQCLVELETPFGNMLIELFNTTPKHRDNFIKLAEEGFYNNLLFHRVINGFMIQGGDPDSKGAVAGTSLGMGGPGYQIDAEISPDHVHIKGALAAARTGDQINPQRKSSGSQFYIVQGRPVDENMLNIIQSRMGIRYTDEQKSAYLQQGGTPQLDAQYTVFGRVVQGLEVLDKVAEVSTDPRDRPLEDVIMKVVVIK
jgi:peptidyl-prolyl cis-trans isomerase B (cyclophilin B)